jgi:hypothetical protein
VPGRRTTTDKQIGDWVKHAVKLTAEINPPEWAAVEVFNAMLNVAMLPDHVTNDEEGIQAVQSALKIVETCAVPDTLRAKAFNFALGGTSAREQSVILNPGNKKALGLH